jgi:hypothetical protein
VEGGKIKWRKTMGNILFWGIGGNGIIVDHIIREDARREARRGDATVMTGRDKGTRARKPNSFIDV